MVGTIILIVLVALGVLTLGFIILRKLPQLRMVDPSTSPEIVHEASNTKS